MIQNYGWRYHKNAILKAKLKASLKRWLIMLLVFIAYVLIVGGLGLDT